MAVATHKLIFLATFNYKKLAQEMIRSWSITISSKLKLIIKTFSAGSQTSLGEDASKIRRPLNVRMLRCADR